MPASRSSVFAFFVFFYPNILGHPDNYIPANPNVDNPAPNFCAAANIYIYLFNFQVYCDILKVFWLSVGGGNPKTLLGARK
jgi:quinol-cytochrome oxidoreductase complex cytochrome b subunit